MVMNKEQRKNCVLIVTSFLLGSILTLIICKFSIKQEKVQIIEKNSLSTSIEKVKDSVVSIETYNQTFKQSAGSGFIYKTDLLYAYILTNEHVTGGIRIEIIDSNNEKYEGTLLGKDIYLDLAVIKIENRNHLKAATLSNSNDTKVGDTVFTIGSPVGSNYQGTVTAGILSGKDRIVETTVEGKTDGNWAMKVLQIDASINPGNSGGPLLNINGEVIGICTMKLIQNDIEGMGFAIPIEYAMNYIDKIENNEAIERPELGITMTNINNSSELYENEIEVPSKINKGVVVLSVKKKGNATKTLKKGDIITKINGKETDNVSLFKYELYQHTPGEKVKITYQRNGKEKNSTIKLNKAN